MADETRRRAEDLLQQALDLKPEERPAFLDAHCDDPGIRGEVELLLEYERRGMGGFLEIPVTEAAGDRAIGGRIGPYEILRELGTGGFGVVYLGEQKEPFQRRVGVKVLKLGMDSRRIVARFEAEKQTLAMMEHPNVAKVLDAGTTPEGRPYFVMEYVPGAAITQHCDEQRLRIADRLQLFLQVCEAIQHAHQKGVIHRDIKPSNVLVQDVGGKPIVKVIDFGIAKFISAEAPDDMLMTQAGEVIGTPEYMAPEQTTPSARNIDTRTDIYQLGVLLYEMLVGALPFNPQELRSAGLSEALRRIREEEPVKPSARLTRRGEGLEAMASQRRSDPASLKEELKGDLDLINMKALAKEPMRRYASASELAADIGRYLRHEPVLAGPPSTSYRIRKFVRRHRGAVLAGATIALAVLVGLAAATIGFIEATIAKKELAREGDAARRQAYRASIAAASALLQSHNVALARRHLDQARDRRGWEWRHLAWLSDTSAMTLRGHETDLKCMGVSRDDKLIASCDNGGFICLWDPSSGRLLRRFLAHDGSAHRLSVGPRSERILTSDYLSEVVMWEVATGSVLWRLPVQASMNPDAFSPDGAMVAVGLAQGSLLSLRVAATGEEVRSIPVSGPAEFAVGFSPDGERLVCKTSAAMEAFDFRSGRSLWQYVLRGGELEPRFDPRGRRVFLNSDVGMILLDAASGSEIARFGGGGEKVYSCAVSPDGLRVATGQATGAIAIWDAGSGEPLSTLHGHEGRVVSLAFTGDGRRLVSASTDGTVKIWDAYTDASPLIAHGAKSRGYLRQAAFDSAFSADGRLAVIVGWGNVHLWDAQTGAELWNRTVSRQNFYAAAFSPDGRRIAAGGRDSRVVLMDSSSGRPLVESPAMPGQVLDLVWTPDARHIIAGHDDGMARVYDAASCAMVKELPGHGSPVRCVAVSPDGTKLASGSGKDLARGDNIRLARAPGTERRVVRQRADGGSLRLWDASSGREIWSASDSGTFTCLAFDSDGSRLAAGTLDRRVMVWAAADGQAPMALAGLENQVCCVGFSPDGSRLAAGCADGLDGSVHIWDAATGDEVAILRAAQSTCNVLAFTPDGATLLVSGFGNAIAAFTTGPPACGFEARDRLRRARNVLDPLLDNVILSEDAVRHLEADADLPEPIRKLAVDGARARGDHLNYLNSDAWGIARSPGASTQDYRVALRKIEHVCLLWPGMPAFLNTLGMAQYRVGDHEAAIATLSRCQALRRELKGSLSPDDCSILAMAHQQLGQTREAHAELERARQLMQKSGSANDPESVNLLREAEALVEKKASK